MAVAAPARRSEPQAAPAPSRTAPPEPKKRPRDRPRPGGQGRSSASAATAAPPKRKPAGPKRKGGAVRKAAAGAKKAARAGASAAGAKKETRAGAAARAKKAARGASAAATAPARKFPARRKAAPKRRGGARVIPIAAGHAGRAAVAVTQLPESGLIHRLTRGRAWIGVLGVLLVGIVALNVVTLSFAASSGKIDAKNTELSKENSVLQSLVAKKYGQARLRHEAGALGLAMSTSVEAIPQLIEVRRGDVSEAAARLAAAGAAAAGSAEASAEGSTSGEEAGSGEAVAAGEEATSGEAVAAGEEAAVGATGEGEFTPEEEAIYNREYEELLAAEGAEAGAYEEAVTEAPAE